MTYPNPPKIGWSVEFTPLPAMVGTRLARATEVRILPRSKRALEQIVVVREGRGRRIVFRGRHGERVLGEISV
jgi:hypothetical protein